ncbi:acyltransferase [Mycobacterium sp. SM3041]|uniref:acyltransferase family protein n=1 Tax=Mycobacterium sp. SM3041 TaxID=3114291 RepID=UPI003204DE91
MESRAETDASSGMWRLGHRPQLDGVRAMAVLMVLIAHTDVIPKLGKGGPVAVSVFFTLSGFLITTLLLEERQIFGRINIPAFYRRRFLRLVPGMLACVVVACFVLLVNGYAFPDLKLVIGTLTYTANWQIMSGVPRPSALGHTWTLSVEEQFYLIWPLLVVILTARLSKRRILTLLSSVCAVVLLWRIALYTHGEGYARIYFGLDTWADSLMCGAIVAVALHRSRVRLNTPRWLVWVGFTLLATACFIPGREPHNYYLLSVPTLGGIGTAIIIYAIAQDRGFAPFGWRWVQWTGKRSYGLYLYSAPVNVFLLLAVTHAKWIQLFVLAGTFVMAALSYRYIEKPFLRIKDRDGKSRRGLDESLRTDGIDAVDRTAAPPEAHAAMPNPGTHEPA